MAGDYIGRLYLTVNKKPQFTVKAVVQRGKTGGG
jgi:hypothetical protein